MKWNDFFTCLEITIRHIARVIAIDTATNLDDYIKMQDKNLERSRDPGGYLWYLSDRIWARCPRCGGAARIIPEERRLSCGNCGHARVGELGQPARWTAVVHTRITPRCGRCGRELPKTVTSCPAFHEGRASAKVRCPGCAFIGTYPVWAIPAAMEEGRDPLFGLPLLLTTLVEGELLWAFNLDHVAVLEDYLGASLRERPTGDRKMTMMARLPRWMKAARNREKVIAGFDRLRAIAAEAGVT